MTSPSTTTDLAGQEALEALRSLFMNEDAPATARVTAAKALFDRFVPKTDSETIRREKEERDAAIADAKCIMAEFAAAKYAGACQPVALAENGAAEPDHAAGDA